MRFVVLSLLITAILHPMLIDIEHSELDDEFIIDFTQSAGVEVISESEPNDSNTTGGAHGALAHGMSEEAARALLSLSQSIAEGENNRTKIVEQMSKLNSTMAMLNEASADDRRIREQLAELNANLQQLADEMRSDRAHQTEILVAELKGLAQSIAALIGTSSIAKRGK